MNYVYLVELDDQLVLWDCGSGLGRARQMILDGMTLAARAFAFHAAPEDIDVLLRGGKIDRPISAAAKKRQDASQTGTDETEDRAKRAYGKMFD